MPENELSLIASCLFLVILTMAVGMRMLLVRIREMRQKRIHLQAISTSADAAANLQNTQAADNFRNLFEAPVLFYALAAVALAVSYVPPWLVHGAWLFVVLRLVHSLIHCTYNRVAHRFAVFLFSFVLLAVLWTSFVFGIASRNP